MLIFVIQLQFISYSVSVDKNLDAIHKINGSAYTAELYKRWKERI